MGCAARHEHKAARRDGDLAVAETKSRLTVCDIEPLVRVRVNVKRGSGFPRLEDPDDRNVGSARFGLTEAGGLRGVRVLQGEDCVGAEDPTACSTGFRTSPLVYCAQRHRARAGQRVPAVSASCRAS